MSRLLGDISTTAGAHWAFGLRQMSTSYRGNIIKVRRTSDDAVVDVPMDADGNPDFVTVRDHCGSNDGYITQFYELLGGATHLVQVTASKQWRVWDGTAEDWIINPDTNRIAAEIQSSQSFYTLSAAGYSSLTAGNYTLALVAKMDQDGSSDMSQAIYDGETAASYLAYNGSTDVKLLGSSGLITLESFGTSTFRYCWKDGLYRLNDDASDQGRASSGTNTLSGLTLGELRSSARGLGFHINGGYFHEIITWPEELTLSEVQQNQSDFYVDRLPQDIQYSDPLGGLGGMNAFP